MQSEASFLPPNLVITPAIPDVAHNRPPIFPKHLIFGKAKPADFGPKIRSYDAGFPAVPRPDREQYETP